MAKRFQPLKEFGRTTKKPKLDVSINKWRPVDSTQCRQQVIRSNAPDMGHGRSPARSSISSNNLWDDDDDDVILLATQVAESQVAIKNVDAASISDTEITFSEFAPHVHATTSTQRILTTAVNVAIKATVSAPPSLPDKIHELFADDDDFVELLDTAAIVGKEQLERKGLTEQTETVFKKPTVLPDGASRNDNRKQVRASLANTVDGQNAAVRRQAATERQIKILTERLDALKAENANLAKDLSESKSKVESKDGEASLLRDELRHMKQQLQTMKMEKIMSAEAVKTECKTKIAELIKRVDAKESELKLRNVEYSVLKMRHADETQRLEMSIRNANVVDDITIDNNLENAQDTRSAHTLHRLRGLTLTATLPDSINSRLIELRAHVYDRTQERGATKRQHTPFQQELANAQTLLAQLQLQKQNRTWNTAEAKIFSESAIESARSALSEFWTYVHGLEFPKHCSVHPYHDYDLFKDEYVDINRNLHTAHELYDDERAPSLRRYIAALSVMCAQAPYFAHQLLSQQHGDYALLRVGCEALSKLGYSREICAHFGIVESFAALLHVLLRHVRPEDDKYMELLVSGLLKQLVFVRPSAWIFREISHCLLELTRLPAALALLCVNSDESTFYSDRMCSLYRFSNDSCVLQVYAGLLEIAFPHNGVLKEVHLRLLAVICENHVRFVHYCFMNPPDFIHNLLPAYDDDEEENGEEQIIIAEELSKIQVATQSDNSNRSTSTASELSDRPAAEQTKNLKSAATYIRCECYTKLCLSVVTLLFQLLRQWLLNGRNCETLRVAEVSQVSVQLLHTIFCDNYSTRLFRYAEETTKHYLWLICEWWSENHERLHFNSVQKNFLNKLRTFHIMPKQLNEEGNVANVINDLNKWNSLTNDSGSSNDASSSVDMTHAAEQLNIMRSAGDVAKFFDGLNGYAFNFE